MVMVKQSGGSAVRNRTNRPSLFFLGLILAQQGRPHNP